MTLADVRDYIANFRTRKRNPSVYTTVNTSTPTIQPLVDRIRKVMDRNM